MPRGSLGSRYWNARLRAWPAPTSIEPGYTLLLPVPGDLPEFLDLALTACAAQEHEHRTATLVIPDRMTEAVDRLVEARRTAWDGPLVIRQLPRPERWVLPLLHSGSRNHGMQLVTGVAAARTTHVILHDADLFPSRTDLHERQYVDCAASHLACLGVGPVWDPWFAQHGRALCATWEMCASTEWLRSFPPAMHLGHDATMFGERHTFDTTLHPQAMTPQERIGVNDSDAEMVHFNYVITTYRNYERQGAGFVDDRYRLLFISMLRQLLGSSDTAGSPVPDVDTMVRSLGSDAGRVRHPSASEGAVAYAEFRSKLDRLLTADWVDEGRARTTASALEAFDIFYGFPGPLVARG